MRTKLSSLTVKIALVVLVVSLLSVGFVAVFSGWTTMREYDKLIMEQFKGNFADQAAAYYQATGSWQGFAQAFPQNFQPEDEHPGGRRGSYYRDAPPALFPFVVLDNKGCVVGPITPDYRRGACLDERQMRDGTSITVANTHVGTVIETGNVVIRDPSEDLFLQRTGRGLLWGAIGASIVALLLGIGLASTLTRPLRRLTAAIHSMAAGDLEQRVDIRSHDEIGELASAFNNMSAELAQSNQTRRQMTADIAHELRNPLMVMTGYIEALRDGVLRPTPQRFDMMYDEAQHLQRLVADLRTLSLADAGELTLNRQLVAPDFLLVRITDAYSPTAAKANVRLSADSSGNTPDVMVDVERIVQVLANLVTNALRHTPAGGEIRLGAQAAGDGIDITVADTGEGIPANILPRIFDRFYRADGARVQNGEESGLGLAIVKSIVTAHGGTITVTSDVGKGSTFTIHLPA